MTATIELSERTVKRAEKLSGINNVQELVKMTVDHYITGAKWREASIKAEKVIGDENPFFDGYDPKA
ncbi:MAG: hypothetical protein LBM77_06970 [Spirochaetaceae bacterium]|jgi:hypothetical protein|nr:hypothetical protein [Spirochaetaceae bacterium]